MIRINIIPSNKKKEIDINKKIKMYLKFLNIIIFNFIIYSLVFLMVKIIMQKYYSDAENQALIFNKNTEDYNQEAKEINEQIKHIQNIQENFVNWSDFFIALSAIRSEGIIYKQIQVNKSGDSVFIIGNAKTRDNLLNFKKTIEESNILSEIELPFSVLLEKKDIDFEIKAKINSYEF